MRKLVLLSISFVLTGVFTPVVADAGDTLPAWLTAGWSLPLPDYSKAVFVAIADTQSRLATRYRSERQPEAAACMESLPVDNALYEALDTYRAMGSPAWLRDQPMAVLVAFSLKVNCTAVDT